MSLMTVRSGRITNSAALPIPIPSLNVQHWIERYTNHLGAVDNFTQTVISGNGAVSSDATNHEMDLSCGTGIVASHAAFETKKTWTLGNTPIAVNMIFQNYVFGAGDFRSSYHGLCADFSSYTSNGAYFKHIQADSWLCTTIVGGTASDTEISAPVNGDLLTIIAQNNFVSFYINGIEVAKHTLNIPIGGLKLGMSTIKTTTNDTTAANTFSVDYIDIVKYLI